MPDARLDDVAIDDLVSDFLTQRRRGERLSISEFAQRHPRWESEIRRLLPAALALERFKGSRKISSAAEAEQQAVAQPSLAETRLGDYVLLEEIGHGGMGVVYRARQTSLGRIVAVKVLRAGAVAGSKHARRFARESQAAAALHHTNIVPVFGVGHQDGIHYYVMQLIEGEGLDEVVAELERLESSPSEPDGAAPPAKDASGRRPTASEVARVLLGAPRPTAGASDHQTTETEISASSSTEQSGRVSKWQKFGEATDVGRQSHTQHGDGEVQAEEGLDCVSRRAAAPRRDGAALRHYWRSVARIGLEAARALEYAHSQGTLHRDIKPGNLIVDRRGNVWITDFGLAKVMHHDSLTETGDVVGTLRYMAPEQFSGQADERSDLYGLGMTLYELATLRPAFDATGRAGLIDQIMRQEPIRPRRVRPAIPRDLETILLKAIARDPNHRYRNAAEMAADLERFLDDRPVRARRVSPPERFWRWCRRNPATAVPTAAAAALLVLACTVTTGAYVNESKLREQAESASVRVEASLTRAETERRRADENTRKAQAERKQAQRQRRLAQKNLALALEAIEKVFERIAPRDIQRSGDEESGDNPMESDYQVVVTPEDAALLESMLSFYDRFAEANSANLKLQFEAARAHRRVGDIHQRLGQFQEAETAYRRSLDLYEQLEQEGPQKPPARLAKASLLNELGVVQKMMGRRDEAQQSHRDSLAILQEQHRLHPESAEVSLEMVRTYNLLGYAIWVHRRRYSDDDVPLVTQAEDNHRKALELLERLMEADPSNPEYRLTLARSYRDLAPVLSHWDTAGAVEVAGNAIEILEALVAEYPTVPLYRYELVLTLSSRDSRRWGEAGFEEGRRRFERAIELAEELSQEFASVPEYASRYAYTCHKFSEVLREAGHDDEAECMLRQAIDLRRGQVYRFPDVPQFQGYLAYSLGKLADLVKQRGDLEEARLLLEESIELRRAQVERLPEGGRFHESLANAVGQLADVARRRGEPEEAQRLFEESIDLLTQLVQSSREGGRYRGSLWQQYVALRGLLVSQQRIDEAAEVWAEWRELDDSLNIHRPPYGRNPFSRRSERSDATRGFNRGRFFRKQPDEKQEADSPSS